MDGERALVLGARVTARPAAPGSHHLRPPDSQVVSHGHVQRIGSRKRSNVASACPPGVRAPRAPASAPAAHRRCCCRAPLAAPEHRVIWIRGRRLARTPPWRARSAERARRIADVRIVRVPSELPSFWYAMPSCAGYPGGSAPSPRPPPSARAPCGAARARRWCPRSPTAGRRPGCSSPPARACGAGAEASSRSAAAPRPPSAAAPGLRRLAGGRQDFAEPQIRSPSSRRAAGPTFAAPIDSDVAAPSGSWRAPPRCRRGSDERTPLNVADLQVHGGELAPEIGALAGVAREPSSTRAPSSRAAAAPASARQLADGVVHLGSSEFASCRTSSKRCSARARSRSLRAPARPCR